MGDLKEKAVRLKRVLSKIDDGKRDEHSFNELDALRQEEYELEGGKSAPYIMGNYRHNLEQTGWKQAASYKAMKKKRQIKGAPSEYDEFISNFRQDVTDELHRTEMMISRTEE